MFFWNNVLNVSIFIFILGCNQRRMVHCQCPIASLRRQISLHDLWREQKSISSNSCLPSCTACPFGWIRNLCVERQDQLSRGTMDHRMCSCYDSSNRRLVTCMSFRSGGISWRDHCLRHNIARLYSTLCNLHSKAIHNYKQKSILWKGILVFEW